MSGIYIPNMEMPQSCEDCHLESFCSLWVEARRISGWTPEKRNEAIRHPDCPLVPVPPHGMLIDAVELFKEMERKGWFNNADRDIAEDLVLAAPTVIEADYPPSTPLEQVWTELFGEEGE